MGATRKHPATLSSALFGKTRRALLALLFGRPDQAFYVREVARTTGACQGAVQRELERLTSAGILVRLERGRQVYYQANRDCPVFVELHGLLVKTAGLAEVIRAALAPWAQHIELAFVFGSQAQGEATASSDVDLFIAGDIDDVTLRRAVTDAEQRLGHTINYTLISPGEAQGAPERTAWFSRACVERAEDCIGGAGS